MRKKTHGQVIATGSSGRAQAPEEEDLRNTVKGSVEIMYLEQLQT